jgi:hypothetical protein
MRTKGLPLLVEPLSPDCWGMSMLPRSLRSASHFFGQTRLQGFQRSPVFVTVALTTEAIRRTCGKGAAWPKGRAPSPPQNPGENPALFGENLGENLDEKENNNKAREEFYFFKRTINCLFQDPIFCLNIAVAGSLRTVVTACSQVWGGELADSRRQSPKTTS